MLPVYCTYFVYCTIYYCTVFVVFKFMIFMAWLLCIIALCSTDVNNVFVCNAVHAFISLQCHLLEPYQQLRVSISIYMFVSLCFNEYCMFYYVYFWVVRQLRCQTLLSLFQTWFVFVVEFTRTNLFSLNTRTRTHCNTPSIGKLPIVLYCSLLYRIAFSDGKGNLYRSLLTLRYCKVK